MDCFNFLFVTMDARVHSLNTWKSEFRFFVCVSVRQDSASILLFDSTTGDGVLRVKRFSTPRAFFRSFIISELRGISLN